MNVCHLCLATDKLRYDPQCELWWCSGDELRCVYRARIRLGTPKWMAGKLYREDVAARSERRGKRVA